MKSIAIIGGGPAGATAAEVFLRDRRDAGGPACSITIFEEHRGWEKPCGGGLPAKALRRYPFLAEAAQPFTRVTEAELVGPGGESVRLRLRSPLAIYSRAILNELLLCRAEAAGAEVVCEHIHDVHAESGGWELRGRSGNYRADFIILAAGARSALRARFVPPFRPRDLMITYGYYAPLGSDTVLRAQFFRDFEGYAWGFPRPGHLSLGICGKQDETSMDELRERLLSFMQRFGYGADGAPVFSHVLPALDSKSWDSMKLMGDGWAVIGDAAGLVDPITGEGIYFAMRSGELLAASLLQGAPQRYPERVRQDFGGRLAAASRLAHRFYHENFLGKPSTTRFVQFCSRSRIFMALLQELIEGNQSYAELPKRLYRMLPMGGWQALRSSKA